MGLVIPSEELVLLLCERPCLLTGTCGSVYSTRVGKGFLPALTSNPPGENHLAGSSIPIGTGRVS